MILAGRALAFGRGRGAGFGGREMSLREVSAVEGEVCAPRFRPPRAALRAAGPPSSLRGWVIPAPEGLAEGACG